MHLGEVLIPSKNDVKKSLITCKTD